MLSPEILVKIKLAQKQSILLRMNPRIACKRIVTEDPIIFISVFHLVFQGRIRLEPAEDRVNVKVIGIKDGKLSLSIKALSEEKEEETEELHVELPKSEEIGTNLGDLFKNIKL